MTEAPKQLGRLHIPDERDNKYLMRSVIPAQLTGQSHRYWWANGWWGNQGSDPFCVAYSWMHWVEDGPTTHARTRTAGTGSLFNPEDIYHAAQKVDQWPGEAYAGTSVRAGAKILKSKGVISEYRWAWDAQTVVDTLLTKGPVVVGTNWYYDMFFPKMKGGKAVITATGNSMGGHAYLLNGVNTKLGLVRIKNSWGPDWGVKGHAYMSIADLDMLIKSNGEACLAVEIGT